MSLYGGNLYTQYVDEDTVFEDCMMESVIMEAKLPADMKIQVEDYRDGSKFKSKFESIIKWMKENYPNIQCHFVTIDQKGVSVDYE